MGSEAMDEIAELELGRSEELIVGFAGQQFGDRSEVVFGGRLERFEQLLGAVSLIFGKMGEGHGNPP
jgi:hypothetical protein